MLTKGSTAIAGRSGGGRAGRGSWIRPAADRRRAGVGPFGCICTSPTKTEPLAGDGADQLLVPRRCRRAPCGRALMRLVRVESDTIRPPQTEAMRSSLLTTRSRFSTR